MGWVQQLQSQDHNTELPDRPLLVIQLLWPIEKLNQIQT
jgi:hypothetical protein